MSSDLISLEITETIALPPTENIQHALGANHDIRSGLDELIDNAIDAGADNIRIVFHVVGHHLAQIATHDDGRGMSAEKMRHVLRLGGHEVESESTIGIYGMGLKEGSYANADTVTVVSRVRGAFPAGLQLKKTSFAAGVLDEASLTKIWNLRDQLVELKRGTTILWNDLVEVYDGPDESEGIRFLQNTLELVRQHVGIRYHRFLAQDGLSIKLFTAYDGSAPVPTPAIRPIDPCGYRKSGAPEYPLKLTVDGDPTNPGLTAHIWTNRSKTSEFELEGRDDLGHQGFYIYIADRLITQGGWSGFQDARKNLKLLRIVIDDPRVIEQYITISPQKGSVRPAEGFHRFIKSLRVIGDPTRDFDDVCTDAAEVLRLSNVKSGNAAPIAEGGAGLAPAVRDMIEEIAPLKGGDPVNVEWKNLPSGEFAAVDSTKNTVYMNQKYRAAIVGVRGSKHDAPLVRTLVYLLFNYAATSKRTAKNKANIELWSQILGAAAEQEKLAAERRRGPQ